MKSNTRKLKERALNSLTLCVEMFNRPSDKGRVEAVLLLLQHALELLLKAKIWEKRGRISEPNSRISYMFDKCLDIALSDLGLIDNDEKRTLSIIYGLRNCAAHNLLSISEDNLYIHVQTGVTLFAAIFERAFHDRLGHHLPNRVLPISTNPPQDINIFLDDEFSQIRNLMRPGRRQQAKVHARLRTLLIMESHLAENPQQPSTGEVRKVGSRLREGEDWRAVFPGISTLKLTTEGQGTTLSIRFTREPTAAPVHVLRPWEESADATLIKEVETSDRYSMGLRQLSENLGLTQPKTLALITHCKIQSNPEYYHPFTFGRSTHKRYSPKALECLRQALENVDMGTVWAEYCRQRRQI